VHSRCRDSLVQSRCRDSRRERSKPVFPDSDQSFQTATSLFRQQPQRPSLESSSARITFYSPLMLVHFHLLDVECATALIVHVPCLSVMIRPEITCIQIRPVLNPAASRRQSRRQQTVSPIMLKPHADAAPMPSAPTPAVLQHCIPKQPDHDLPMNRVQRSSLPALRLTEKLQLVRIIPVWPNWRAVLKVSMTRLYGVDEVHNHQKGALKRQSIPREGTERLLSHRQSLSQCPSGQRPCTHGPPAAQYLPRVFATNCIGRKSLSSSNASSTTPGLTPASPVNAETAGCQLPRTAPKPLHPSRQTRAGPRPAEGQRAVFCNKFGKFPIGDGNYRPIVVNIAQDLDKFYIVLDKIWSKQQQPQV